MIQNKLLFGVCGIGKGHTFRQLPIINYYSKYSNVAIFAYGESLNFYSKCFKNKDNVKVFPVKVPWIQGGSDGIDYIKTAKEKLNLNQNFELINFSSMDKVLKFMGKPDLVISDYEPISAQFAYSLNAPFITVDQESRFFYEGFPEKYDNLSVKEEIARLSLFFPKAKKRIACTFFKPPSTRIHGDFNVKIVYPVIREDIIQMKNNSQSNLDQILVYLSPYSQFVQQSKDVLSIFKHFSNKMFNLFVSKKSDFATDHAKLANNIKIYLHGDPIYPMILRDSVAAICTSGHTFISEMMFLNKPIYTIPLQTYDQKCNANIISENEFGIAGSGITKDLLSHFLSNISNYKDNIVRDNNVLLNKHTGQSQIISCINKILC